MKLVLSRKGFDSSAGGAPSPIFHDGRLLSLPIPDKQSPISYCDIECESELPMGQIVEELTDGRIPQHYRAHLDPDLVAANLPRKPRWKSVFGQVGASQGHLENQAVGLGDIFLFFGLFRFVEIGPSRLCYVKGARKLHVIHGWLQVEEQVKVDGCSTAIKDWASEHPHMKRSPDNTNTLYIGRDELALPDHKLTRIPGAGAFKFYNDRLRLTAPKANGHGKWLLPEWFHPANRRSAMTYHSNLNRWERTQGGVLLDTVGRGQEFVLDCDHYPEAAEWIRLILAPG